MGIFINKLHIQNYKCFDNETIYLNTPNGTPGSGLNILIGENGNGKTSILEAINYLTLSNFSAENKLNINDFTNYKKEIIISAKTNEFSCKSSISFYKDWLFKSNGIEFNAKSRVEKERGKLLSSPFKIDNYFNVIQDQYIKGNGDIAADKDNNIKTIDGRDKIFDNSRLANNEELNIFYFDKNRTRQISTGNYKTTFEKICDDLNWNFVKNITEKNKINVIQNITGEYFQNIISITNKSSCKKTAEDLKEFFNDQKYGNLKIELLNLLHPYSNSFFALRNENDFTQINIRNLGSGIEIILTILLLKNIAGVSKGSIIYLIDEPELHLHPKAQERLLNLLIDESKNKQIIISTHSPYLFRGAISEKAKLLLFTRDNYNKILISNARDKDWGLFPWSPSWGEINFFAYGLPTIEFHNELYGYLHEIYISKAGNQQDAENRGKQTYFEKNFLQVNLSASKKWTPEYAGIPKNEETITLSTFIRNKAHHPENKTMQGTTYSDKDLLNSITELIKLIKTREIFKE